jgi:GntR family transcriptional regulator
LEHLDSILEQGARQGMKVGFSDLEVGEISADHEGAEKLQITPGTSLTEVARAIVVDTEPVAYMVDAIRSDVLKPEDIDDEFNGSVLDLLRQKEGLQHATVVADLIALNADAFLAEKLGIEPGQAVLLIEELLFDETGRPVEYSRNYFVPEFFRFHVVRS